MFFWYFVVDVVGIHIDLRGLTKVVHDQSRLGKMIKTIESHTKQIGRALFFLAENVVLRHEDEHPVSEAFGISPLKLDSSIFSPTKRSCLYWTNVAFQTFRPFFRPNEVSPALPTCCLEDGYSVAGNLDDQRRLAKANTFMAPLSRVDDSRMLVFRPNPQGRAPRFVERGMYAWEHGRMMGFPENYVVGALEPLYKTLRGV